MLCIHVVCASLLPDNQAIFNSFASDTVEIDIIIQDADRFLMLHLVIEGAATQTAMLKFVLPELLHNNTRVLYLDGDILVKGDLSELYNNELEDNYAACVLNSFTFYREHFPYEDEVESYFNSGVMLLILQLMREDNIINRLIETKKNAKHYFLMDQITFNYVFEKHVALLPVRYNYQILSLPGVKEEEEIQVLNKHFGTQYSNLTDVVADAVVVHFASLAKPWKKPLTPLFEDWYLTYLESPVKGRGSSLAKLFEDELVLARNAAINSVRKSWSFRIGYAITWLPRMVLGGIHWFKK